MKNNNKCYCGCKLCCYTKEEEVRKQQHCNETECYRGSEEQEKCACGCACCE